MVSEWAVPRRPSFAGSTVTGQTYTNGGGQQPVTLAAAASNSTVPSPPTVSGAEVTVTRAGVYALTGGIRLASAASGARYTSVQVYDGTSWKAVAEATSDRNGIVVLSASATVYLVAGNKVQLTLLNSTGAPITALTDNPPRLSVVQLPTTQPSS